MTYTCSTPRLGIVDISSVAQVASLGQPGNAQLPAVTTEAQFGEIVTGWDPALGGGEFMFARAATTVVAAQTISSITISGTTATVTTGSAHGLVPGYAVTVSGAVPSGYNGTYTVLTTPTTTTFTITVPTATAPTVSATTVGTYVVGIGAGQTCELAFTLTNGTMVITATPWAGTTITAKPLGIAYVNLFPGQSGWLQVQGVAVAVTNGTITVGNPLYYQANGTLSNTAVASKQMDNAVAASVISAVIGQGNTATTLGAFMALVFINRPFAQGAIT